MASTYIVFEAQIPLKSVGKRTRTMLNNTEFEENQYGVFFMVEIEEGYGDERDEHFEYFIEGVDSDRQFNGLFSRMVRENRVSLTEVRRYSNRDDYRDDEDRGGSFWEELTDACPTLVLREILARRLED